LIYDVRIYDLIFTIEDNRMGSNPEGRKEK